MTPTERLMLRMLAYLVDVTPNPDWASRNLVETAEGLLAAHPVEHVVIYGDMDVPEADGVPPEAVYPQLRRMAQRSLRKLP